MNKKTKIGRIVAGLSALMLVFCALIGVRTATNNSPKKMAITEETKEVENTEPTETTQAPKEVSTEDISYMEISADGTQYAVTEKETISVTETASGYMTTTKATSVPVNNVLSVSSDNNELADHADDWAEDDALGTAAYVPK